MDFFKVKRFTEKYSGDNFSRMLIHYGELIATASLWQAGIGMKIFYFSKQ